MNQSIYHRAIIYCRVSNVKQTIKGDGLNSQETRCREYARHRGYEVVQVFRDDVSGKLVDRPGMKAMLAFIRRNRKEGLVVIIDDISRLARGIDAHVKLRAGIAAAGGRLESPSVEFGDDADSELQEFILATVAQHQRRKNAEQVKNRMRARAMNGYWVFQAPWGYTYGKGSGGGRVLVRSEPLASIITEALNGFASGRFNSQTDVKHFLDSNPEFPTASKGYVLHERVMQILGQPLYAGYLEVPRWNISLRKANHEPLISLETYNRIQERLKIGARSPTRSNLELDFPLRGHIACADCGGIMTATWSKGKTKSYAYYLCRQPDCVSRDKSIARKKIEGDLEALLRQLTPAKELFELASAIFKDLWNKQVQTADQVRQNLKREIAELDSKIRQLLDRIVEAESPTVIGAYEQRVSELERAKLVKQEKSQTCMAPRRHYEEVFQTSLAFLANPWILWQSDRLEDKRAVLKLAFTGRLAYSRVSGFQTPEKALPFRLFDQFSSEKEEWWSRGESNP